VTNVPVPAYEVCKGQYADPETLICTEAFVVMSETIDEDGLVDDPWAQEAIRLDLVRKYGDKLPKMIVYIRG
jgi:hypothetical protein